MGELPAVVKNVTRMSCEIKEGKLECGVMTLKTSVYTEGEDVDSFIQARDDRWLVDVVEVSGHLRFAKEDRDGEFEVAFEKPATCKLTREGMGTGGYTTLDCE